MSGVSNFEVVAAAAVKKFREMIDEVQSSEHPCLKPGSCTMNPPYGGAISHWPHDLVYMYQ